MGGESRGGHKTVATARAIIDAARGRRQIVYISWTGGGSHGARHRRRQHIKFSRCLLGTAQPADSGPGVRVATNGLINSPRWLYIKKEERRHGARPIPMQYAGARAMLTGGCVNVT